MSDLNYRHELYYHKWLFNSGLPTSEAWRCWTLERRGESGIYAMSSAGQRHWILGNWFPFYCQEMQRSWHSTHEKAFKLVSLSSNTFSFRGDTLFPSTLFNISHNPSPSFTPCDSFVQSQGTIYCLSHLYCLNIFLSTRSKSLFTFIFFFLLIHMWSGWCYEKFWKTETKLEIDISLYMVLTTDVELVTSRSFLAFPPNYHHV